MSLPIENRMNFFSDTEGAKKRSVKDGRNHAHMEIARDKSIERDFAFNDMSSIGGSSVGGSKNIRGVGVENRKFVARFAQKNAQLSLQQYEADVLKMNLVSMSKAKQRDANLVIANLYKDMGDKEGAIASIADAKFEMAQINDIDSQMMALKNTTAAVLSKTTSEDATSEDGVRGSEANGEGGSLLVIK